MAGPSFSSFSHEWTYKVFLSFRGQETRHGFTGHLYNSLCKRGIYTFIDDEQLQRGEQITPALLKAIEGSRIAIVVFSKTYASSSFCLDELSKIIECREEKGQLVLPVFYDVDPSDVRHHGGTYGKALAEHEEKFKDNMERLEKWKMALHRAANLSGWHLKHGNEYEYEFIEKIVKEVSNEVSCVPLHVEKHLVGMESRVLKVNSLLNVGSDDAVHMVGICGIGGIGKTTVARAVYNLIADQFDGLCFLGDVREKSIKHGLVHLQETLLSEMVGEKDIKLGSVDKGITLIKERLCQKKVLLVLDDVDKREQLEAIVGGPHWFASGSKVIITTRDKQLLIRHGIEKTYEVEDLNEKEALELLSRNAFKSGKVDPRYVDTLNCVVTYASGLPLALGLIGSNLFGKSIGEWKSALVQYKRIPNKEIQKILKVSYDALEENQQKIFLDIACYFKGHDLTCVEYILCAHHGGCLKYGIGVLVEKSLIKIEGCSVTLHDLIQDMGREIVRQESPEEPGKRSRLWCPKDIAQVLEDNTGSRKTQIIILDSPKFEEVDWDGMAFKKMKNLKTLIIRNVRVLKGPPKHLPNSLRVLEWPGYPSESLPSDFHPKELVILDMPSSRLTSLSLPKMQKKFVNLRVINFSYSECIKEIPDVSGVPNLKELRFRRCANLIKIHESVGFLGQLKILDASGCKKLRTFPPIKLTSLEELGLSDCSSLESFPEILGKMENIIMLDLFDSPIKELPSSIRNLTRLRFLFLSDFGKLHLSSNIFMLPGLGYLTFTRCEGLRLSEGDEAEKQVSLVNSLSLSDCIVSDEFLPIVLPWFANVEYLNLSGSKFTILPACIKECPFLRGLDLNNCKLLQEIRGIPPNIEILKAGNCTSLTSSCRRMLLSEELHEEAGNRAFALPGTSIPEWFEHSNKRPSISFWFRNNFPIISVCLVVEKAGEGNFSRGRPPAICLKMIINGIEYLLELNWRIEIRQEADHVYIFDIKQIESIVGRCEVLLEYEWNHVVLTPVLNQGRRCCPQDARWTSKGLAIRQSGMHVFKQSSMEDIHVTDLLLLKEDHRFVNMGDAQGQFMQQQQKNLASLEPQVGQGREPLLLLPPPEMKSLNNNVNRDSNSMVSTQINRTTSVQGCETASRKRKINALTLDLDLTLGLDSEACETFCQAPSKVASDPDSKISSFASEGGCETASRKRKINALTLDLDLTLGLDSEACETFCQAPSKVASDSDSKISSFASEGGLQELPIIQQSIKGCESVNEAKEKGMEASNSNNGEDNGRSPLLEMLPKIKEYHVTSDKNQHASNEVNSPWDPMELEYQVAYPKHPKL